MSTTPVAEALSLIDGDDDTSILDRGGSFRGMCASTRAVANWHDEQHAGTFASCDEQPCRAVRMVDGGSCLE